MFRVEPFKPEDFFQVEGKEIKVNPREHGEIVDEFYRRGIAFTAFDDDEPIACAGIAALDEAGVGLVWMNTSAKATAKVFWFHRVVGSRLREVIRTMQLDRVIAEVDESNLCARRWIETLGFTEDKPTDHFAQTGNRLVRYVRDA